MSTLTFKNSTEGRAAKNSLDHLLANYRDRKFTYADFPPCDREYLDAVRDRLKQASETPGIAVMAAEDIEQWAKSEIIGPLERAGYVEVAGYHTFIFTELGKDIGKIELQHEPGQEQLDNIEPKNRSLAILGAIVCGIFSIVVFSSAKTGKISGGEAFLIVAAIISAFGALYFLAKAFGRE